MTSPTLRTTWQRARFPVGLLLAVLVTALLVVATSSRGSGEALDPESFAPQGSRALAQLLRTGGARVDRINNVPDLVRGAKAGTMVFAPLLADLSRDELTMLAALPGELVLVAPTPDDLDALSLPVHAVGSTAVQNRRPACDLPAAVRAGIADIGGVTYESTGVTASIDCYDTGGRPTLLRLPARRITIVGSGQLFTNDKLASAGNASLALGVVGAQREVRWLVPALNRPQIGSQRTRSLSSFIPVTVAFLLLQIGVVLLVHALWRARRLGRVVPEPLPVVVRAAEAAEGRGRLYRAARATDAAAEQLRAAARHDLGQRLGASGESTRITMISQAAVRTGRDLTALDTLLYGPAPADDAALVRLASDLDELTREVADA